MGTISHFDEQPALNLNSSNKPNNIPTTCLHHDYNTQTISMLSEAFSYDGKETLVDRIKLEQSPLTLSFVSYDRNSFETGVVVKVFNKWNIPHNCIIGAICWSV